MAGMLLAVTGVSFAQAFHKKGGNDKLNAIQADILRQQVQGKTAGKGADVAHERLVGAANYQMAELMDSSRYVYSGSRYSDVTNLDINSYSDNFFPSNEAQPFELGKYQYNYLAYDTLYYYESSEGALILSGITVKGYDGSNRIIQMSTRNFYGGNMVNDFSDHIDYAGSANDIQKVVRIADTSFPLVGLYDTTDVFTSNYGSGGERLSDSMYSPGWPVLTRIDYAYTSDGLIASGTYSTSMDGVSYNPGSRSVYTYDGSGRLVTSLREYYDGTGWYPNYMDSFSYTGSAPLYTHNVSFGYDNVSSSWEPEFQLDATLMPGFTAYDTVYIKQDDGDGFNNWAFFKLSYNTNQHLTTMEGYPWMEGAYLPFPVLFQYFYYEAMPVSVPAVAAQPVALKFYPNPATSHINVEASGKVSVSVYNLSGQLLIQQSGAAQNGGLQLNVASLPAGTYVADVQTEKGSSKVKFAKQ